MTKDTHTTTMRSFRKLEDLNVIDNFLFQQLLTDDETGAEFARILLKTFLGKPIRNVKVTPQKNILGIDTDKHGIRMDAYIEEISDELSPDAADAEILPSIYDIEPNNGYEKDSLPKRMRYYHGLIDTQLLSAGSGYENLPNVVIFIILPYDPFGKNRMVYSICNQCEEDPTIPYNDGAKKIFLYTGGTAENASQPLKDMLKYIQESTDNNVTNQDIATIQELVNKVKHKKEVGINYMKSWEYEKMIKKEARETGYKEGFDMGYSDGYSNGHDTGYNDGFSNGHDTGYNDGFSNGHDTGFSDGFNDGFNDGADKMGSLILLLTKANRSADIEKAVQDKEYRKQLFHEFNLH